jgi:hypothetical protein
MVKAKMGASKMGKVKTAKPSMGSASKRADGVAVKGKTKGKMMYGGGMAKMMAGGGVGKAKMMASGGMPMVMKVGKKFQLLLLMVRARWLLVVAHVK